jgi:hypothetical protein
LQVKVKFVEYLFLAVPASTDAQVFEALYIKIVDLDIIYGLLVVN